MENTEHMTIEEFNNHKQSIEKKLEDSVKEFEQMSQEWKKQLKKYFSESTAENLINNAKDSLSRNAKSIAEILDYIKENFDTYSKSEIMREIENASFIANNATESIKKIIGICQAADECSLETVKQFYLELDSNAESRYRGIYNALAYSTHADVFVPMILEDIESIGGKNSEYYINSKRNLMPNAQRAAEAKVSKASAPQNGGEEN